MADTLSGFKLALSISGTIQSGQAPAIVNAAVLHQVIQSLTIGSGAGNINKCYSAPFTVTNGSPLLIDLTSVVSPTGAALTFASVAGILLSNDSIVAGQDFTLGAGTNGLFTAEPNPIKAIGGVCVPFWNPTAPLTVDGTHKIVQIVVAAGTAVPGQLTVVGK